MQRLELEHGQGGCELGAGFDGTRYRSKLSHVQNPHSDRRSDHHFETAAGSSAAAEGVTDGSLDSGGRVLEGSLERACVERAAGFRPSEIWTEASPGAAC